MSENKKAFCGSRKCVHNDLLKRRSDQLTQIEKQNVKRGQSSCPDCGHILVWRDPSKKRIVATRKLLVDRHVNSI